MQAIAPLDNILDDPEEWIGTRVELFVDDQVAYAGKRVGGVRLRKPKEGPF